MGGFVSHSSGPLRGRHDLFVLGDARFGSVPPVGDAAESLFDRQLIDCIGIVFIRPFFGFSMALVGGVCNRFKPFEEARNSAAILGRSVSFAANEALSVIEVGTSTWRQISGSVCRNSIRTVAISLTLSDAVFILAGLMRSVWQPGSASSRVGAGRGCGYCESRWGALLGKVQNAVAAHYRSQ